MTMYATKLDGEMHIFYLNKDEPMEAASRALKIWQALYELTREEAERVECGRVDECFSITVTPMKTSIVAKN
jgi:hypothetical protein